MVFLVSLTYCSILRSSLARCSHLCPFKGGFGSCCLHSKHLHKHFLLVRWHLIHYQWKIQRGKKYIVQIT